MTQLSWQADWERTQKHFRQWWSGEGMVFCSWGGIRSEQVHEVVPEPSKGRPTGGDFFEDPDWRAEWNRSRLAQVAYPGDSLPVADTMVGPGSLALLLGSEPGYSPSTVWFEPTMVSLAEPESEPPFRFDESNRFFQIHAETCRANVRLGHGKYLTGCPDLVENVDILSALRDPQHLMMDMIERPEWVEEKVLEINEVWFAAYERIYEIIKLEDGSSAFACFGIWGPGKTAKVQCDAGAMFSPAMFKRFVVPALTAQCAWLDNSLFHLDGTQCICHLDHLLEIEPLTAIEWTPQAGIEGGGSPRWHEMYRRILAAGKSLQVICVKPEEVIPLLDAIGSKGVYIHCLCDNLDSFHQLWERVEAYR